MDLELEVELVFFPPRDYLVVLVVVASYYYSD
jgi:hypothetical protein